MAYNAAPQAFFGPGFTESSAAITLKTSEATGVTTGTTFQGEADDDVLTFAAAHNLKVGDRVRVTQGTTLPTGLSAATDYWVKTVPSTTTLTLASTKGGTTVNLTTDGTADNTCQAFGPLDELTEAEIDATSGDWRKTVFGIVEMLYQRWNNTDSADRPTKLTITRSSSTNETTGIITRDYTFRVRLDPIAVEVTGE